MTALATPGKPLDAVMAYLDTVTPQARPEAVTLAIRQLSGRAASDLLAATILAWEAYDKGYWSQVRRLDGRAYESAELYLADVLGLDSWRSAWRRIVIGRALAKLPEPERVEVGVALASLGIAKASVLAPALEKAESAAARERWLRTAEHVDAEALQAAVSGQLGSGRQHGGDAESGFLRLLLRTLPEDAREGVRAVFALGQRIARLQGADEELKDVALFLFMVRQVKKEWELVEARLSE